MLVEFFWVAIVAGGSAAVVLWVLAARLALGVVRARGGGLLDGVRVLLWPFGARQAGASTETAILLNKMMVACFIALLIAIASMAVYSNLTFVPPVRVQ
ncbi:hypothetical protein MWN33_10525 [Starkeya koreensis]|uniref:Uncharacterized protein n=1 Tax=Ancylobacter koreensis TaxID=266121 RepID=A0ABT0DMH9_9HYPH|nr:hypothetical protein [Ancylobacter koreensis]MCK0208465.1 hypothetical protein [Ancylobacter koreensis]